MLAKILNNYWSFTPFTDAEAWMLFKLAAIGEAVGWTLLISGIIFRNYIIIGNQLPVQLAGRVHGVLFLLYIVAALILSPSLKWSWARTFVAGIASVPPYGSLLFELWAARVRKNKDLGILAKITAYKLAIAIEKA